MDQLINKHTAWQKIQKYCAYQERCHKEVRNKLYDYGLYSEDVEALISELIQADFLNEERFSKAFAGGKFRSKKWGRNKILQELKYRNISDYCIKKGLNEIDSTIYEKTLKELIDKKIRDYRISNSFILHGKVATYCIGKGFEPDLVWEIIKALD